MDEQNNEHQGGEDRPPQQEDGESCGKRFRRDKRGSNPGWRQKHKTESHPEAGVGAESGCAKGIACLELLYARNELDETTIE